MVWECKICLEVDNLPIIFNCGHTFCYSCRKQEYCPICREKVTFWKQNYELNEIVKAEIPAGYDHNELKKEEKKEEVLVSNQNPSLNLNYHENNFNFNYDKFKIKYKLHDEIINHKHLNDYFFDYINIKK